MKRKKTNPRNVCAAVMPFDLTIDEAHEICGGLSQTSKMPCASYGLPAKACQSGARLAAHVVARLAVYEPSGCHTWVDADGTELNTRI